MTGRFLGEQPPEPKPGKHFCHLPASTSPLAPWTVWRCECGLAYRYEPKRGIGMRGYRWRHFPAEDLIWYETDGVPVIGVTR